jgi:hypothetical protein
MHRAGGTCVKTDVDHKVYTGMTWVDVSADSALTTRTSVSADQLSDQPTSICIAKQLARTAEFTRGRPLRCVGYYTNQIDSVAVGIRARADLTSRIIHHALSPDEQVTRDAVAHDRKDDAKASKCRFRDVIPGGNTLTASAKKP